MKSNESTEGKSSMNPKHAPIFEPITINGCEIKNRIVMSPMNCNYTAPDHYISKQQMAYYAASHDRVRGHTEPVERMASLDRNILRIATFELIGRPDVPVAVILDEAVELAKRFGTDDSGRFVNGVLSGVARAVR